MLVDLLQFTVKPGNAEKVIGHMKEQTVATREDEGCVLANVFQDGSDQNTLYMLLAWESQEAVDKHMATAHDLEFRNNVDDLIAGPPQFLDWKKII
jgi:quinol monooxygenase YgiN